MPEITEELLETLITKYKSKFEMKYPKLALHVYFTSNGQPLDMPEANDTTGSFRNRGKDYLVCIKENQTTALRIMTFFHEYGHALYRRETCEMIDNIDAEIRSETAALEKSLKLADIEGLPGIGRMAVVAAICLSVLGDPYLAAMNNAKGDPLWLKYS